jgi:micrococcal nuclease
MYKYYSLDKNMKKILVIFLTLIITFAITPVHATNIPNGAVIRTANNPDVYIVKYSNGKDFKRLILNPKVFQSYGHLKWENILTVDQNTMNSFNNSDLVRVDGQTQIYELLPSGDSGNRISVSTTDNIDLDSIYTINATDFASYAAESELYSVNKVIDGDTISVTIDGKNQTIRLIGINSPEVSSPYTTTQCFGPEASAAAKSVLTGKKVRLESDPASGDKDKYVRLLRYVYLEDGTPFDQWMISQGYAYEYTYKNISYEYQSEFKAAQIAAKKNKKGLWKQCYR